jgi:hypothetical protein
MRKKKGRTWGGPIAGNAKMKGRPSMVMSCGCCVFYNRKRYPTDADLKKILERVEGKF